MALTETFEYDCEVRGPYKAVQVRKARIIKDGDQEIISNISPPCFSMSYSVRRGLGRH